MIKESDIFGGTQWTKRRQYSEEIRSLLSQIYNTVESHGKLSCKKKKMLKEDMEQFKFALMQYEHDLDLT
jgi:hypothetical protein